MAHNKPTNGTKVSNNNRMLASKKEKSNAKVKDNIVNNEDLNENIDKSKKDCKRPSREIYRPGMGLQIQKNFKSSDDMPDGEEHENSKKSFGNNSSDINCDTLSSDMRELQVGDKSNLSSKQKLKNRRPDKQVYVPKPKIASLSVSPQPPEECQNVSLNISNEGGGEKQFNRSHDSSSSRRSYQGSKAKSFDEVSNSRENQNARKNQRTEVTGNGQEPLMQNSSKEVHVSSAAQLSQFNKRNAKPDRGRLKETPPNERAGNAENRQRNLSGGGKNNSKGRKGRKDQDRRDSRRNDRRELLTQHENTESDWETDSYSMLIGSNRTFSQEDVSNNHRSSPKMVETPNHSAARCESPAKPKTMDSPKGRGRGSRSVEKQVTPIVNQLAKTAELNKSIFNQDGNVMEKVPTLIYERSRPPIPSSPNESEKKKFFDEKFANKSDFSVGKIPAFHENLQFVPNKVQPKIHSEFINVQRGPEPNSRDLSEFQQNPPPRFRQNMKDRQSAATMIEKLKMEKQDQTGPGIIKVASWDTISSKSEIAQQSAPISWEAYGKPYPQAYNGHSRQLYDPSAVEKKVNHTPSIVPTMHQYQTNCVQNSPMEPIVNHFPNSHSMPPYMEQGFQPRPQYIQHTPFMPNNQPSASHINPPHLHQVPANLIRPAFSDHLMHQNSFKKRVKPLVEKNLHDVGILERELNGFLSKGLDKADLKSLGQCRWKLQLRYENIILADPRFCADRNVENALWKSAFHQVIEAFRRIKENSTGKDDEINRAVINLVEEGTVFYESLLEKQQETFGINLSQFLDCDFSKTQTIPDSVKVIFISVQKIYICLGDLARYREQATNTTNYGKARSWYLKAQQIAPKNGRPYNQLAILAIYARRKLDAVYFYMRSLAASNPFLSARESLLSLFDEARKKYESAEKKRNEKKDEKEKFTYNDYMADRIEIWIRPNGQEKSRVHSSSSKDESLRSLSAVELNKRFVLSFLHVQGKLFTKIGMEHFTETTNQMLQEFRCLLQCTPFPMASQRVLQLLAINMFAVANTALKSPPVDTNCRPLIQEQALQVSLSMVAILIERSTVLLQEHKASSDYPAQLLSEDLMQLLPVIKVWVDWMSCQKTLWNPLPTLGDLRTGCKGDIWMLFANLLNEIALVKDTNMELKALPQAEPGYEAVVLPEDLSLACFTPLLGAPQETFYALKPIADKERARVLLRLRTINFFGDYLTGIETPYLKFDVQSQKYVSLVTMPSEENSISEPNTGYSSEEDGVLEDEIAEIEDEVASRSYSEDESHEIAELWSKKETLKRDSERNKRIHEHTQRVLQGNRRKTLHRIAPRYLIPDTNCFIDHLNNLKIILGSKDYHMVVPLIVINELDGLAKGEQRPSSAGGHRSNERSRQVGQAASEAIHFLEGRFAARDPRLRAITAKGSHLDTISFRSEEHTGNKGTNDDIILNCCLTYCNDKAEQYMPKDPSVPVQIHRDVVLLTDDRNLSVKALTAHVPVQNIQAFIKWADLR